MRQPLNIALVLVAVVATAIGLYASAAFIFTATGVCTIAFLGLATYSLAAYGDHEPIGAVLVLYLFAFWMIALIGMWVAYALR